MKVGIFVYSQTNNTLGVAVRLQDKLSKTGNEVVLNKLEFDKKKNDIVNMPEISGYDLLIFASPVQAFTLAVPMKKFLKKIEKMEKQRVVFFITQGLKRAFFGGNRAISILEKKITSKGGEPFGLGIIHWGSEDRETQIKNLIDSFDV